MERRGHRDERFQIINHLIRCGWVDIIDAKENGEFRRNNYIKNYARAFYKGAETKTDQYGHFLVWSQDLFENYTNQGKAEDIKTDAQRLSEEGWQQIRTGLAKINGKTEAVIVAIKRKRDVPGIFDPQEKEKKRVKIPIAYK